MIDNLLNKKDWAVLVLVVVAVVLGIAINNNTSPGSLVDENTEDRASQKNLGDGERTYSRDLSDTEVKALNAPYNGTDEEKRAHYDLVVSLAKNSNTIDIKGCLGNPLVSKFSVKTDLVVKNSDNVEHTIVFDEKTRFVIPAKSEETIKGVFNKGIGLYGYGCDGGVGSSGLLLVTE